MSAVWDIDLPASDKIVLLALADNANDDGLCWPGMAHLVAKCSKGERTIQASIKRLVELGHLTRVEVLGKGCKYTVHPRNNCAPAEIAPPQKLTQTPAKSAGKPSRTTNNKKIARELPENWMPEQFGVGTKSRGIVDGWPPGDFEHHLEHFAAHHHTRGNKFPDWQSAWRTWVLNNAKFNRKPANDRQPTRTDQIQDPLARVVAERQAERLAAEQ